MRATFRTMVVVSALLLTASLPALAAPDTVGVVDQNTGVWSLRDGVGDTYTFYYGNPSDVPIAGDWNCDGTDTPGLYRQSDGLVYLRNSNTQGKADVTFFFGNPGDVPIAGDFNNDGCDTVSIYRPPESRVFVINELGENGGGLGAAELDYHFGNPGDTPFTGDFDDDGVDTVGLYRQSTGEMYFRNSHTQGNADFDFFFGNPGDRFVGGDWTDDGTDSPGVFRPSDAFFYLKHTNTQGNADETFGYGNANSYPVAGRWGDIPATPDIPLGSGIKLHVTARSAFDKWTENPSDAEKQAINALYERMTVWSPYFDTRLSWFPRGLAYIDLYAIYTDTNDDDRSAKHPEWILRDGGGNRLYIPYDCGGGTCPQYAGDFGHPAFRQDLIERIRSLVDKGYPGIMLDDVNLVWRVSNGNGDDVIPIDPRSGSPMTLTSWRRYMVEVLEMIRSEFPGIEIMHNAVWFADTPNFTDPYVVRQTRAADWIQLERGATDGGLTGGDSKWSIRTFFRFIDVAHSQGTEVLLLDEGDHPGSTSDQEYNLAAYLLINNGRDLVGTDDLSLIAPDRVWSGFLGDLGDPVGPRYDWRGVIRRDYERGMVLLNEPEAAAVTLTLPGTFRDLDGVLRSTVHLSTRTAAVLSKPNA